MKKLTIFLFISLIITLSSCGDVKNPEKCLESVRRTFPNSKIYREPGTRFTFLVIDSIGVRKVKTANISNTYISDIKEYEIAK